MNLSDTQRKNGTTQFMKVLNKKVSTSLLQLGGLSLIFCFGLLTFDLQELQPFDHVLSKVTQKELIFTGGI